MKDLLNSFVGPLALAVFIIGGIWASGTDHWSGWIFIGIFVGIPVLVVLGIFFKWLFDECG